MEKTASCKDCGHTFKYQASDMKMNLEKMPRSVLGGDSVKLIKSLNCPNCNMEVKRETNSSNYH